RTLGNLHADARGPGVCDVRSRTLRPEDGANHAGPGRGLMRREHSLGGWSWPENRAGVARDHQVLVGGDHPDRAGAFVGTDDRVMAGVPLGIEADAEMLESGTDFPAHWRGMLADPAREDEGVDPAQDRGERADVLAELMAEE